MVDEVLTKYGQMIVAQLQSDIKNKPLPRNNGKSYVANASGKLAKSINFKVENGVLRVYADSYIYFIIYGRNKNSKQEPKSLKSWVGWAGSTFLKDWVEAKGLSISPFAVAYSIARKGTSLYPQGSTLLSDIVNETLINGIKNDLFTSFSDSALESFRTLKRAA